MKNKKKAHYCLGNCKRQCVPKPSALEVLRQGRKQVRECTQEQTYSPWMFKLQDHPYKLLFCLRDPKAQNRHSAALFRDVRRKQWDYSCKNECSFWRPWLETHRPRKRSAHEPWAGAWVESEVSSSLMRRQFSEPTPSQARQCQQGPNYKGALSREEQCLWNQCFGRKGKQICAKSSFSRNLVYRKHVHRCGCVHISSD